MNHYLHRLLHRAHPLAWTLVATVALLVAAGSILFWYNGEVAVAPEGDSIQQEGSGEVSEGINNTPFPLSVPDGFELSVYAEVPGARVIVRDGLNNLWVSQTEQGTVSMIDVSGGTKAVHPIFQNLNNPHGLAIEPGGQGTVLYIAEEHRISRVQLYSDGPLEQIASLPEGGRHSTRTIEFGPDGRLYVSIGSSCDVCEESDERRGAIYSMNPDGSDFKEYASGLRNSVFLDWSYVDGAMWATEMGRDHLGDNLPPDEINVIEEGNHYGWPYCYGENVHDASFDSSADAQNFCRNEASPSTIELQAHSAPLGLAFIPEEGWDEAWWYDLLVAYHGSWNRSEPTGYKVVRMELDADGTYHATHDFITGWLGEDGTVYGRPVDILTYPGGEAFITDDEAGLVYRLHRTTEV